jgi:hypothetical protein
MRTTLIWSWGHRRAGRLLAHRDGDLAPCEAFGAAPDLTDTRSRVAPFANLKTVAGRSDS